MKKQKSKAKLKPWRETVKNAMKEAAEREAIHRHKTSPPPFNYRWEHVTAVVTLAVTLAHLLDADVEVVEAAAWLHDVRKDTKDRHPQEGAKFARALLPQTDFPKKKIKKVARAIEEHMGLWRDEPLTKLESQILWDADKLSKIGLTAVFHWAGRDFAGKKPSFTSGIIKNINAQTWMEKTVASMHTKPAKRAAHARLKALRKMLSNLEAELNGEDLK